MIFENLVEAAPGVHGNVIARVVPVDYEIKKLERLHGNCKSEGKRLAHMLKLPAKEGMKLN